MDLNIRRAAVLGAGVMGAQIAAHLAATGVRTYLLDLPTDKEPEDPKQKNILGKNFRSARAILAIENLKQLKPSPLVSAKVLAHIVPGNFEDDWSLIAEADWIIEAVVERLDIKKNIHAKILEVVRGGVPVSTNTSGIALEEIAKDLPEHYQQCFMGTHFFNPPRYMHLVEIIPHELSDKKLITKLSEWIALRLGKGIVMASDTINFIANRIGVLAIQATLKHMDELGLNIATVDALTGPLIGRPKSATLRTMDVVGLDTYLHVAQNVYANIKDDPFHSYFAPTPWVKALVDKGFLGQKSVQGGCYRKCRNAKGETVFLSFDPKKGEHVEQTAELNDFTWLEKASAIRSLPERLKFIFSHKDKGAEFLWRIHRDTFSYSALLLNDIAHGLPKSLDDAMCWGFNWEVGPFETWQAIGYEDLRKRITSENAKLPSWCAAGIKFYEPEPNSPAWEIEGSKKQYNASSKKMEAIAASKHQIRLPRRLNNDDKRMVIGSKGASLVDLGDGVACLSFHSKMNTLNDDIIEMIQKSTLKVSESFAGLVIANDGDHFSAGAYLGALLDLIEKKDFKSIDQMIRQFQGAMQLLKFAPFPTVSAPHGMALGGGCELCLQTSRSIISCETYAGLVEIGVGLIPAGGGTKELALRSYQLAARGDGADPMAFLKKAFLLIGMAKVSTSGHEAIEMGLFSPQNSSVMLSQKHQTLFAKKAVLNMVDQGYAAPMVEQAISVIGDPGVQTFRLMLYNMSEGKQISAYDAHIATLVATVLCGGTVDAGSQVSENYFLDLERLAFVELCQHEKTKDRIAHMLKTGKPLRN